MRQCGHLLRLRDYLNDLNDLKAVRAGVTERKVLLHRD